MPPPNLPPAGIIAMRLHDESGLSYDRRSFGPALGLALLLVFANLLEGPCANSLLGGGLGLDGIHCFQLRVDIFSLLILFLLAIVICFILLFFLFQQVVPLGVAGSAAFVGAGGGFFFFETAGACGASDPGGGLFFVVRNLPFVSLLGPAGFTWRAMIAPVTGMNV